MAEETKKAEKVEEIKTTRVEVIKFHPLIAHDPGDEAEVREATAKEWVEKKFAKLVN